MVRLTAFSRLAACLFVAGLMLGAAGPAASAEDTAEARLNDLFADYWERTMQLHPGWAVSLGREAYLDQFGESLSDGYREARIDLIRDSLARLNAIDREDLGTDARLSYDIFAYERRQAREYWTSDLAEIGRMLPMDQMGGAHSYFAVEAAGQSSYPFETLTHYEKALIRANGFGHWVDLAIWRLRQGVKDGVTLPRIVVKRVLPQLEAHLDVPPEETPFYRPVSDFPDAVPESERARLRTAFRDKIAGVIQPAYRRLYDYLKNEYMPEARETAGVWDLPNGEKYYRYAIRSHTTTDMSAEEIHAIGMQEVERIMAEIDKVRKKVGFEGTVEEFLNYSRTNEDRYFASAEDKMQRVRMVREKVNDRLPRIFHREPPVPYEIRKVPEFLEEGRASAYYQRPAPDGSRPGIFWVNTHEVTEEPDIDIITLSLHEAVPGHHYQISLAQRLEDLPQFRRHGGQTAYVEGWGLYAETLGKEMGLYEDPWQYLGHLSWEVHRANRLVVDTGLHAMKWTREEGIQWLLDHSAVTKRNAVAEVERFMAMPGQALAYKIGQLKILELRQRAKKALGDDFDIRAFHDAILLSGSMPLPILERHIERWIEEQKAG